MQVNWDRYNVGTGLSRSFNDVANSVLQYFDTGEIEYIDFPDGLESQYQAFTEANTSHLRSSGFSDAFTPLEESVVDYLDWLKAEND